jgi:antibiotic biosynthesis monooxygenase (ABM) superfamily enzyme
MSPASRSVSLVTQTGVRPESAEAFARWQGETSVLISRFPGFLEQRLLPPRPPQQVDWVILQRFASADDARRWLVSPERQARLDGVAHMLMGQDDVHIVQDDAREARRAAAAAIMISTRVLPGKQDDYRAWERRMEAAQSRAPGLLGYRFEPAIPGVQDDHVTLLRFDTDANLQAWLASPERRRLVEEAAPFTQEFHTRLARSGFESWFRDDTTPDAPLPPVWKMDMLVLLTLYPVVFLFATFVGTPILIRALGLPLAFSLFIANCVSVILTGLLVPRLAGRFRWWLRPAATARRWLTSLLGAGLIAAIYALMVVAFWRLF